MIYAYEGEGSEVGSLSSLVSNKSDLDQEYEYIKEWGPKFYKLSSIFVNSNSNGANANVGQQQFQSQIQQQMHQQQQQQQLPPQHLNDDTRIYQTSNYQFENRGQDNYYN